MSEDKVCIYSIESHKNTNLSRNLNIHVLHSSSIELDFHFCNSTTFVYVSEKPHKADREQKVRVRLISHYCVDP